VIPRELNVIIRANGYFPLLAKVIRSLEKQKATLLKIIIVDSSSEDVAYNFSKSILKVVKYPDTNYNYARAINIGLPYLTTQYALVISSHTSIENTDALQAAAIRLDEKNNVAAICFSGESDSEISFKTICSQSYNGWNGTWNTASLYRTQLLRERQFRPDILSAEDQEWTKWALFDKGLCIEHAIGCSMLNMNPRRLSFKKRLREWEFISYYCYPYYLSRPFVLSRFKNGYNLFFAMRWSDSFYELCICIVLLRVRFFGIYSRTSSY